MDDPSTNRVDFVRDKLPTGISWESIAAVVVIVVYILLHSHSEANLTPFLLERSETSFIFDFVLLASAAGLGLSALRRRNKHGPLAGAIVLIVAGLLLVDWLHLLLNWPSRRWG